MLERVAPAKRLRRRVSPPSKSKIHVPAPEADQPRLVQVGVIAAVCFAIGALWPTLSGVSLVPSVPTKEEKAPKAKPKPARPAAPDDPDKEVPVAAMVPGAPKKSTEPSVEIDKTLVVNCRDAQDRRLSQCDTPGFDDVARDRIKALAACDAARDADGVLSIGFELDFEREKITSISSGKSSTVSDQTASALVECAKREFMSATLRGVEHTHARYLVFYMARIRPPGAVVEESPEAQRVEASGTATVIWNSARIRTQPDDGKVKERLLYGTKVVVTARQGDWYKIRYDSKGSEGWVHKNALAL